MFRKALLILLLTTLGLVPVTAQSSLETYTSQDGRVSLSYPHGWRITEYQGQILLTTTEIPNVPQRTFQAGEAGFLLDVFRRGDQSLLGTYAYGTNSVEMLETFELGANHAPGSRETMGDVTPITVGRHPAARSIGTLTENKNTLENIMVDFENGGYGLITITTAPDDLDRIEPKMLSIAASIEYNPPAISNDAINLKSLVPISLHNVSSLKHISTIAAHVGYANSIAISPDGQTIASGGNDGGIRLWDASTGQQKASPKTQDSSIQRILFSPDGKYLISGDEHGTVRLWDAETGEKQKMTQHNGKIWRMAISPDGQHLAYIAFANGNTPFTSTVWLWDIATDEDRLIEDTSATSIANGVAFSPDGQQVLYSTISNDKFVIRLYDVADKREISQWSGSGLTVEVFFTSDSHPIVSKKAIGQNDILLWNPQADTVEATLPDDNGPSSRVILNPDRTLIATITFGGTVGLWDAHNGDELTVLQQRVGLLDLAFSPDNRLMVTSDASGFVYLWGIVANI